jgi:hypothetical protein
MTEYLSRRDHSEKELRTKLSKFYSAEEIQIAIEYGKSRKWIPDTPEEKLEFSNKVNIPIDHLDVLFWHMEHGEYFK